MVTENYKLIKQNIESAARESGRSPDEIKLVGATKHIDTIRINEAIRAGLKIIGENIVQEAELKFPNIQAVEKHFIGHLQSNKVKKAVELFDCIQSVDSVELATKINETAEKQGKIMPIYLEVNIGSEDSKHGFNPDDIELAVIKIRKLPQLRLTGLMCIPPKHNPLPHFRQMAEMKYSLGLKLSMGMSSDYEWAIKEGSDMVRIGTALFGKRL